MTKTLTDKVVPIAARSGCRKISIGIESISRRNQSAMKSSLEELREAASLAKAHGIRLVGLLMLGYPGQTLDDVKYILELLEGLAIHEYRFTGYTPLELLREVPVCDLDSMVLEAYDRRTFYTDEDLQITPKQFYEILIRNDISSEAV